MVLLNEFGEALLAIFFFFFGVQLQQRLILMRFSSNKICVGVVNSGLQWRYLILRFGWRKSPPCMVGVFGNNVTISQYFTIKIQRSTFFFSIFYFYFFKILDKQLLLNRKNKHTEQIRSNKEAHHINDIKDYQCGGQKHNTLKIVLELLINTTNF